MRWYKERYGKRLEEAYNIDGCIKSSPNFFCHGVPFVLFVFTGKPLKTKMARP
jgi:hypothetical protein